MPDPGHYYLVSENSLVLTNQILYWDLFWVKGYTHFSYWITVKYQTVRKSHLMFHKVNNSLSTSGSSFPVALEVFVQNVFNEHIIYFETAL